MDSNGLVRILACLLQRLRTALVLLHAIHSGHSAVRTPSQRVVVSSLTSKSKWRNYMSVLQQASQHAAEPALVLPTRGLSIHEVLSLTPTTARHPPTRISASRTSPSKTLQQLKESPSLSRRTLKPSTALPGPSPQKYGLLRRRRPILRRNLPPGRPRKKDSKRSTSKRLRTGVQLQIRRSLARSRPPKHRSTFTIWDSIIPTSRTGSSTRRSRRICSSIYSTFTEYQPSTTKLSLRTFQVCRARQRSREYSTRPRVS